MVLTFSWALFSWGFSLFKHICFSVFTEQCWQFYPMFSSCKCNEHPETKSEHLQSAWKNTSWNSLCSCPNFEMTVTCLQVCWSYFYLLPPSHSVTISCILVVLCRLESIFPRICGEPTMRPFSFAVVTAEVTAIFGLQAQTLAQGQSVRGGPVSELKFIWLQSLCFYCTRQFEWISVTIDTDCGQPVTWKKCPFGCIFFLKNPTVKEPITITYGYKHESRCSLNSY